MPARSLVRVCQIIDQSCQNRAHKGCFVPTADDRVALDPFSASQDFPAV
jgi:hypothetical protein